MSNECEMLIVLNRVREIAEECLDDRRSSADAIRLISLVVDSDALSPTPTDHIADAGKMVSDAITPPVEDVVEKHGEALFKLSGRLRAIDALADHRTHEAYEKVVATFLALTALPDVEAMREALEDMRDTLQKLRGDLAEEDAERHAQRIAVIDMTLNRESEHAE